MANGSLAIQTLTFPYQQTALQISFSRKTNQDTFENRVHAAQTDDPQFAG
jgi:hypothetical protein